LTAYVRNLEKLGIKVDIRTSDFALHQKRMDDYDFDMTTIRFPDTQSPGNELYDRYGSAAAKEKGSDNVIGVQSPVVDALIDAIVRAETREQLQAATRSLDRVLWNSYYVVPHWYSPTHRIAVIPIPHCIFLPSLGSCPYGGSKGRVNELRNPDLHHQTDLTDDPHLTRGFDLDLRGGAVCSWWASRAADARTKR
jgi:ABC-type transport system substrate-binding protein